MAGIGSSARPALPVNSGGGNSTLPSMGSPIPPARRPAASMGWMARPGTAAPQSAAGGSGMSSPIGAFDAMSARKVGDTGPNGYTITDRKVFATGSRELQDALARIRSGGTL